MGDIFLSYSSRDREVAARFAGLLELEKLTVWWDRKIPAGEEFDLIIEKHLSAAKCVIVLWSQSSVRSRWVRSEASVGSERDILLPVLIESAPLPIAFKLLHAEDLTHWDGDARSEAWSRVVLQAKAIVGNVVRDGGGEPETPPSGGAPGPAGGGAPRTPEDPKRGPPPFGAQLTALVVAALWVLWFVVPQNTVTPLTIAIGLALIVVLLFRLAENDISARMKALAAQWLMPRPGGVKVSTAEALNHLFEAVFGERHFSSVCFVRTAFFSIFFLALLIVLVRTFFGATVEFTLPVVLGLILFGGVVNVLGDYVSLYKTRLLLRAYQRGWHIVPLVAADLLATAIIFLCTVALALLVIYGLVVAHDPAGLQGRGLLQAVAEDVWRVAQQPYLELHAHESPRLLMIGYRRLLYCAAITTYMGSLWLLAALVLSPLIRLLVWSGGAGLTVIGFVFDVEKRPFAALGYLAALIIMSIGLAAWALTGVFSGHPAT